MERSKGKKLKWYYVEYDTFSIEGEIQAEDIYQAEQIAQDKLRDLGCEIIIEELVD